MTRVVKLTLTIEHPDDGLLAEDSIVQADDESDGDFADRMALLLSFLRARSGTHPPVSPGERTLSGEAAARVGLSGDQQRALEILVRTCDGWALLGDAIIWGVLTACGVRDADLDPHWEEVFRETVRGYVARRGVPADLGVTAEDGAGAARVLLDALDARSGSDAA
jgi:hypothetical protein